MWLLRGEATNATVSAISSTVVKRAPSGTDASRRVRSPAGSGCVPQTDAARVRVCASSLTTDQGNEASTKHLLAEWEEYSQQFSDSQFYRDACAENLLKQLGQTVFAGLATEMPNLPKNEAPPPDVKVAFTPTPTLTFEDAIQQGCAVLAWNRDNFESWWQDARARLV